MPDENNRYTCPNVRIPAFPEADDPAWEQAPRAVLSDTVNGETPFLLTEFRILRDDDAQALYLRFAAEDDRIVSTFRLDDECLYRQDVFEVFLSSGDEPGTYVELEASPYDVRFTGLIRNGGTASRELDMDYDLPGFLTKTRFRPGKHQTVSVWRVPYAALGDLSRAASGLRVNVFRIDHSDRGEDLQAWQPTGEANFHIPERFGYLVFGS